MMTPGPWSDDDGTGAIGSVVGPNGEAIAQTFQIGGDSRTQETRKANARAIAALPELIEALKALADLYDTDEGCRSTPEYIAARAALLKAGVTR